MAGKYVFGYSRKRLKEKADERYREVDHYTAWIANPAKRARAKASKKERKAAEKRGDS